MAETEMVERIARAILDDLSGRSGVLDGIDDDVIEEIGHATARAAIEAMRTPTDAMNEALDRVPGGFGRGAWIEGIDAALSPASED